MTAKKKTGKPGPAPAYLSDGQRSGFLDLIRDGFGVNMAVAELKVSWEVFDRTRKADAAFRNAVERSKTHLKERLVALRTSQAFGGDGKALDFTIGRLDAAERFEATAKHNRNVLELQKRAAAIQERLLDLKLGATGDQDAREAIESEEEALGLIEAEIFRLGLDNQGQSGQGAAAPEAPDDPPGLPG